MEITHTQNIISKVMKMMSKAYNLMQNTSKHKISYIEVLEQ